MRLFLTTAISAILATQLYGGDVGIIVANEDYDTLSDVRSASDLLDAEGNWAANGFAVSTLENGTLSELKAALNGFEGSADGTGRLVIAVSANFAKSSHSAWLLGSDAVTPSLFETGGINVATLLELASRSAGQSVVLLGTNSAEIDLGFGLEVGVFLGDIPQGVTVITGPPDDLAEFASTDLLIEGQSLAAALENWSSLQGHGFLAPLIPFYAEATDVAKVEVDPDLDERSFWTATKNIGSVEAYRGYLTRYENGLFAIEAGEEITRINNQPKLRAEANEKALGLSRDARREIQRSLSLIGFDPKGIDGIFGRGTRAAISAFQNSINAEVTGFITSVQIEDLTTKSKLQALALEREAAARKLELEKKDRAYWEATGSLGDEAGLRAYLTRYPDGVFAEIATARLEPFEAARRDEAQAEDRALWDDAVKTNTIEGYQLYLQNNPNGAFVEQAQDSIAKLKQSGQNAEALAAAERNEARLGLNAGARRLVEDRLEKAGLKPGAVDGTFDDDSRRAIRRFQEARNLRKTGYLDQATMVRLLADAVFR